ncbi:hypothetical protein Ptr902_06863 [Pyrenophora tritici-repentis]|nr:hypothetical protein L13192_07161 [Pyrenophora tritici-repentis]KAI1675955.1 hypothetical protein L13192_02702 [Pyrenophora tritici-repentis]KAI2476313.1 hypothetical protein Ptr902_12192 [Pyrenophora tritici-repentis]KAI2482475.1 hypothetical protein Ptr902_06856 [Pyrenophora tritici-repentis]KAI2482482.1 hypothetical protein Ptr902_06863 [Pyrenophora tritici-repentis]
MKVSTMIATIALIMPAIQAQFCNRNTPLVCCLEVKSQCVCPDTPANCCDEDCDGSVEVDKREINYVHPEMRALHKEWRKHKRSLAIGAKAARPLLG